MTDDPSHMPAVVTAARATPRTGPRAFHRRSEAIRVPTTEAARNEPKIVPSVSECMTRAAIIMTTNCSRKKPATPHVARRQNRASCDEEGVIQAVPAGIRCTGAVGGAATGPNDVGGFGFPGTS